ncbi:MAG TPA: tetratricopeptide repeat protein [Anaeromyxobacter sp.]|nr:tetratricopeptide repeat protein [Anaeromyxobacter sp.]
MNRYTILGLAVGLVLGVFIGYQAGSSHAAGTSPMAMPGAPTVPQMPAQAAGPDVDVQNRIAMNQSIVARDPRNVQAWVQLGNDYFDTRQAQKAIEAYGRALELKPNDPNVLTDQGVMYRALGQYDKAIDDFQKANKADPSHIQSLFNMGVVYAHDLKDPKKATVAWNKVIQLAPTSEQAAQARQGIDELKATAGK